MLYAWHYFFYLVAPTIRRKVFFYEERKQDERNPVASNVLIDIMNTLDGFC